MSRFCSKLHRSRRFDQQRFSWTLRGAHSTSDDDSKYRTQAAPEAGWDSERQVTRMAGSSMPPVHVHTRASSHAHASERQYWEARSPVVRFGRYLYARGWYNGQMEYTLRAEARKQAIASLNSSHAVRGPDARHLFTDVYDESPWFLQQQQAQLKEQIAAYREHYTYLDDKQLEGL